MKRDSRLVDRNSKVDFPYCILDKFYSSIIFDKYLVCFVVSVVLPFKLGDSDYLHCFAVW